MIETQKLPERVQKRIDETLALVNIGQIVYALFSNFTDIPDTAK